MSGVPDRFTHLGGQPVSGNPYLGMWGEKTWFVDYDNGTKGGPGNEPGKAFKYPDDAITAAAANDIIYIRPRSPNTANFDPNYILPESTTNSTIASTQHGLAIIGTGYGRGQGSQFYTYWRGTATATATPTLKINAPWTLIENLSFHDGASTSSECVELDGQTSTGGYACGNTVSNCMFRFSSYTALSIDSVMWATVLGNTFHKGAGILISSNEQVPDGIEIGWNHFVTATAAEVDCDIYIADCDMINIHNNYFTHALPTGGTNKYIYCHTAATGIIAHNFFGDDDATVANLITANGLSTVGNWSVDAVT